MTDVPDGKGLIYNLLTAAEWSTRTGEYKSFVATANGKTFGQNVETGYIVPAGKVLYINHADGRGMASVAANADLPQMLNVYISCAGTGPSWTRGGDGGAGADFSQSLVYVAGDILKFGIECRANHAMDLRAYWHGYEV
jgi:hypothetical protein